MKYVLSLEKENRHPEKSNVSTRTEIGQTESKLIEIENEKSKLKLEHDEFKISNKLFEYKLREGKLKLKNTQSQLISLLNILIEKELILDILKKG